MLLQELSHSAGQVAVQFQRQSADSVCASATTASGLAMTCLLGCCAQLTSLRQVLRASIFEVREVTFSDEEIARVLALLWIHACSP